MPLAARFHAARDVRLSEEPSPVPGPDQSLVEITAVGLCGSDLHWYDEGGIGDARLTRPLVGGHEFAGVVRGGELDGQRVAVDPAIACWHCDMCHRGQPNMCRNILFAGHSNLDGGLQQQLAWPTHLLNPLPDGMSDAEGAMLEPLGVSIHAFDLGHVPLGSAVAVIGVGPIGLCLQQVVRAGGARHVVTADLLEHRRGASQRLGADLVLDPSSPGYTEQLIGFTNGLGVDVAFEVAGTDDAITAAVDAVRPGGRVVLTGIPSTDRSSFPASEARRKGVTFAMVRGMKEVYPRAIDLVGSGLVDVASIVTHHVPLTEVDKAFRAGVERAGLKVMVDPQA